MTMKVRPLRVDERSAGSIGTMPVVIEPSGSAHDLSKAIDSTVSQLLARHKALLSRLGYIRQCQFARHKALLFRGWDTSGNVLDILHHRCGLATMREYWPAELGRDDPITFGSTTIWATNRLKLTGGFLGAEVVPHTELLCPFRAS